MFAWVKRIAAWSGQQARLRILQGNAPSGILVSGRLDLSRSSDLDHLPPRLAADTIDLTDCRNLKRLPAGLACRELILRRTPIEWLPPDLNVEWRLDARDCRSLRKLPPIRVDQLSLHGCVALEELPKGLQVRQLDISNCPRIAEIPAGAAPHIEHLNARGCTTLVVLPEQLTRLIDLDISGCTNLEVLPGGMRVRSWIDVAGTAIRQVPWSLRSAKIHWRGVAVPDRIAFDPESITVQEIFSERNLELRRIMLERVGMEWFVTNSRAQVVDRDEDAGGERQLLRIRFDCGEDVVCVSVRCPSTGKRYVLRVPPDMQTCRQAVSWTAGFANPDRYQPAMET